MGVGVYWDEEEDTCRRVLSEEEDTLSRCIRVAGYWMRGVRCVVLGVYWVEVDVFFGVWGAGCRSCELERERGEGGVLGWGGGGRSLPI